jgi:2-dehydropantoate 2-reductase
VHPRSSGEVGSVRILVAGAGAMGGYFGGRLALAGREVTFLVRRERAARLRTDGLEIVSPQGALTTLAPQLVLAGEISRPYDVVLLAVKSFGLPSALDDLAVAVGRETMILPVLNGVRHIDLLVERFGEHPVLGGMCFISATLDERGRVVLLTPSHDLTYGERNGVASERIAALDALLQCPGVTGHASTRILAAMWEKWIALATLGGITCLMRGTVGDVATAPGGAEFGLAFMAECAATATACGYPAGEAFYARWRENMTRGDSKQASSMYRDLEQGNDVEVEPILGDLLERARKAGVATPLLAAAYTHLKVYQRRLSRQEN